MNEEPIKVVGEDPGVPKQVRREDRLTVPLTVYIGGKRRIIGTARVEGDQIEAYINPKSYLDPEASNAGQELLQLIIDGVIMDVSIAFNAPPATPVVTKDGKIDWLKNY